MISILSLVCLTLSGVLSQNVGLETTPACGGPDDTCSDPGSAMMQKVLLTERHPLAVNEDPMEPPSLLQQSSSASSAGTLAHIQSLAEEVVSSGEKMNNVSLAALETIVVQMQNIIDDTNVTFIEDQGEVNLSRDIITRCGTTATTQLRVVTTRKSVFDQNGRTHSECRLLEKQELKLKHEACDDFNNYATGLKSPIEQCSGGWPAVANRPSDTQLECIQAIATWAKTANDTYLRKQSLCTGTTTNHTNTKDACNTKQDAYENAFCSYADQLNTTCGYQDTCRNGAIADRTTTHHRVRGAEIARKAEYKSAKHVLCLLNVLNSSTTDMPALLAACNNHSATATSAAWTGSHLSIVYPAIPGAVACDTSPVADDTCQQAWQMAHYGSNTTWYDYQPTGSSEKVAPKACTLCTANTPLVAPTPAPTAVTTSTAAPTPAPTPAPTQADTCARNADCPAGGTCVVHGHGSRCQETPGLECDANAISGIVPIAMEHKWKKCALGDLTNGQTCEHCGLHERFNNGTWIQVDLGSVKSIALMKLWTDSLQPLYTFGDVTIEISTDRQEWQVLRTDVTSGCSKCRETVHGGWSELARYIKLVFTHNSSTNEGPCGGGYIGIGEWQVTTCPSQAVA